MCIATECTCRAAGVSLANDVQIHWISWEEGDAGKRTIVKANTDKREGKWRFISFVRETMSG
jgi:hypothetical protein